MKPECGDQCDLGLEISVTWVQRSMISVCRDQCDLDTEISVEICVTWV